MDWKKWGNKLTGLFGGSAAQPANAAQADHAVKAPPAKPAPSPAVQEAVTKIAQGTQRRYSPQELDTLSGFVRDLKDVTQTNLLAIGSLLKATPKSGYEEAAQPIVETLKVLGGKPHEQTEEMLGNYVLWANQVEEERGKIAKSYDASLKNDHLPVTDFERWLVIGLAQSAMAVYKQMSASSKQIKDAEPFLDIPQVERIKAEYAAHEKTMNDLTIPLCVMARETVGKEPAQTGPSPTMTMSF